MQVWRLADSVRLNKGGERICHAPENVGDLCGVLLGGGRQEPVPRPALLDDDVHERTTRPEKWIKWLRVCEVYLT